MTLRVELSWPHKDLSPNSRAHFMAVSRAKKAAKSEAGWATKIAMGRDKPTFPEGKIGVRVLAFPPKNWSTGDDDNITARLKAAFDGIAAALDLNDSRFRQDGVTWGAKTELGSIVIEIGS